MSNWGRAAVMATILATGTGAAQAAFTTAPSVTYFTAPSLTITPTGPTTINVAPGATFNVEGAWSGGGEDPSCSLCVVQAYLAGLSPLLGQINLDNDINFSFIQTGNYSGSFTAPLTAGTYYIGAALTYDFDFVPGVIGFGNGRDQVSYIINVGEAAIPEPLSAALLGAGLLGLAVVRRRRASADA